MSVLKFKVQPRKKRGKSVRSLRREGIIPGAISLYKKDTILIQAPKKTVIQLTKITPTTLVEVEIEGGASYKTLLTEMLRDPIKEEVVSFNLTEITENSKLKVDVPIKLVGESPVIKKSLGVLVVSKPFVKLVLNSKNLIKEITIDLAELTEIGDTITVADALKQLSDDIKLASSKEEGDAIVTIVPLQKTLKEEDEAKAEAEETAEVAEGEEGAEATAESGTQEEAGEQAQENK